MRHRESVFARVEKERPYVRVERGNDGGGGGGGGGARRENVCV